MLRYRNLKTLWLLALFFAATSSCLHADDVVVNPSPAPGPLDNPLKGWCPYTNAGEIDQPYSMVFLYAPWKELEPNPGDFRFDAWEKSWDVDAAKGKHIIFRIYIDYPSLPSGLPTWLRAAGVKETTYEDHGGGVSPDYDDPKMVAAMERFIEALGQRYNKHPRIAFIQLGMLGFWGEWHTWPREEMYASPQTEQRIIDAYHKAFPDKSLMVRYARDYAGRQPWIGFHDDMFPQDTDNGKEWSFLSGLRSSNRTGNWASAVIGGEMVPNQAGLWLGPSYEKTTKMLERSHFSWVGPYCPALEPAPDDEVFRRRSESLVRKMGYEFQLTEIRHPRVVDPRRNFRIALAGRNKGVAPFYYPWSVEWALLDSSGRVIATHETEWDVREWLPGRYSENADVQFDVPAGEYQLGLGIRDPWRNRPAIKFANRLPVKDGWTIVSNITVAD